MRFWGLPIVVALAVLSALAAFYLGGILQPMTNLRHFPVAILNEDAGPTGAQVVKGMQASFDNDAYDVRVLNHDQAKTQLDNAEIYGIAVIPPNFSSKLQAYAKSALTPGRVERAVIIVSTNPRAGTLGASYRRPNPSACGHADGSACGPTAFTGGRCSRPARVPSPARSR